MAGSFIVVNLFGSSVLIRVAEAEVGVARLLADALVDLTGDRSHAVRVSLTATRREGHHVLVDECDDSVIAHHRDGRAFLTQVVHRLNRLALDLDPHRLHLHAAAVTRVDGTGVLIVGASGAGKSTLATDLLLRGSAYLGDELIALGAATSALGTDEVRPASGQVVGYPKPISLKGTSVVRFRDLMPMHTAEGRAELPASSVGEVVGDASVGVVVFPRYVAGATSASTCIGPTEATRMLLSSTMDAERYGARSLAVLAGLAVSATCVALTVGDDADAAARIVASIDCPAGAGPLRLGTIGPDLNVGGAPFDHLAVAMMADGNLAMNGSGTTFGDIAPEQLDRRGV
ncbi:MAG: hypothetical protein IPI82_05375, partial [Candidatus Microthrix sp.]